MKPSLNPLAARPFHSTRARIHQNLWNMPTEEQAIKAYRMFVAGNLNPLVIPDLCKHWEISQRTLMNILHRKAWKDFPFESFLPPRAAKQTPVQGELIRNSTLPTATHTIPGR